MPDRKHVFVHSPDLDSAGYPKECPFNTQRAGKALATVRSMGLLDDTSRVLVEPACAGRADLEAFHTPVYLDALQAAQRGEFNIESYGMGLGTPDCPVFAGMYDYVSLAVGASLTAARLLRDGKAEIAFNPSGGFHHAGPGFAAGFCYLNDVVLAARLLAAAGKRVCFLDIDVHHCDGVQDAFVDRADVMTVSLHESGRTLFPGTGHVHEIGTGPGRGYTVNLPLPVGTYDAIYMEAFRAAAWPLMQAFDPDVVILELGMDALAGDPLAHLNLTNNTHADIIERVLSLGKPILATGGGGYHVENTVRGWALAWSVLCGAQAEHDDLMIGMGGVMLETSDWAGGLRDRPLLSNAGHRTTIDTEVRQVIESIKQTVFPLHGL